MSSTQDLTAPARSQAQRMAALERANRIRVLRARLKVDLVRGEITLARLLSKPPDFLQTATRSSPCCVPPRGLAPSGRPGSWSSAR